MTARVTITGMKTGRTNPYVDSGVLEAALAVPAQAMLAPIATSRGMAGENRLGENEAMIVSDMVHRPGRGFAAVPRIPAGEVNVLL